MGDPAIYTNDFTRLLPAAQFFALGSLSMYIYWIVGLCVMGAISYFLYTPLDRQVAGTLFFIFGVLFLYYYYIKWFVVGVKNQEFARTMTPCPDYLTLVTQPATSSTAAQGFCVDFVGVSRNGNLKQCTGDAQKCITTPGQFFPVAGKTESVGDLRDRTDQAGLIWTSMFGDV
jgi:hypothetical protein